MNLELGRNRNRNRVASMLAPFLFCLLAACGSGNRGSVREWPATLQDAGAALLHALAVKLGGRAHADQSEGPNPPLVFNASASASGTAVVSLQGADFGLAPVVTMAGAREPLEIVNRIGQTWLAVRIPERGTAGVTLRIRNADSLSAPIKLDIARPAHLDTLQLVPGGAFRLFGRNLRFGAARPVVTVDGKPAAVDLERSDEFMLSATAPAGLAATAAVLISVDNGSGSGAAALDRTIEVVAGGAGSADPFGLGVGWAGAFAALAANVVDAASDPRLPTRMICNGSQDDSPALQAAIELAASHGGGVVRLPVGRCRMAAGMQLRSHVVVQGAGKAATELVYESNYPVFGYLLDLSGVRNLTLTNAGSATEAPLLKQSRRVFLQNLRVQIGRSRQMHLTGNRLFVVSGCDFVQGASISHQGPYLLNDSAGLVFEGNTTRWLDGAPGFGGVHDSLIGNNRFTRDAANQANGGTVHSLVLDFAFRVAVLGNTFDVANGPITDMTRNDGEALLSEGGGAGRTENLGQVAIAGPDSFSDPTNTLDVDPFGTGAIPENYGVAIVAGRGAGQTRRVLAYQAKTVTIDRHWDQVPDASSRYATFVWGLEKSIIKDNKFSQNPRGIWLYHAAMRDIAVVGNSIGEGGGIYLRSYQNLATRSFMPIYNVQILRNRIGNGSGRWLSYVTSVFVNADARAFGIATLGVEMNGNEIVANRPNVSSGREEYAGVEGFMNMMRAENYGSYESSSVPRLLGALILDNKCTYCETAIRIGTGAGGTTIINTRLIEGGRLLEDWATTSAAERSVATVIR